jgi:FkbM family methyltransferase
MKKNNADKKLLAKYEDHTRKPKKGYIVDYFGCKLNVKYFHHTAGRSGDVLGLPDPSDGILHEFIEYLGTVLAVDSAKQQEDFVSVELGAGWGPWIIRSGVLAKQRGLKNITLVGVEADKLHFNWMADALNINNLREKPTNGIRVQLYEAAVSAKEKHLLFPAIEDSVADWGAAATQSKEGGIDYRGRASKFIKVPAIPLKKLLQPLHHVDLMHVDIQGSEFDVIKSAVKELTQKCRVLVIGTHNRKIEGDLLDLLFKNGWYLRNESPCQFVFVPHAPSLTGMTTVDGTQIWINPRFEENSGLTN